MSDTVGWREWFDSLDSGGEYATLGEAVRQFAHDVIERGGDIGPSGDARYGIDEGMMATSRLFDWFEAAIARLAAEEMERKAGSYLERMAVRYARKPTAARFEALADAVRRADGVDDDGFTGLSGLSGIYADGAEAERKEG